MKKNQTTQIGASLIEVLVAMLILAFGMLSLSSMLSLAVQLPKLSAYRATAANLASSHVERMRANPEGFANPDGVTGGSYTAALNETTWDVTTPAVATPPTGADCSFAGTQCTPTTLAIADIYAFRNTIRRELPAGDMITKCTNPTTGAAAAPCLRTSVGELWIVWQEPSTFALLDSSAGNCPAEATTAYSNPAPTCLYVRFKVE
jgi:type IV pilus assembly protein PilV